MSRPQTERNPVEVLAEEFVERQRRGEDPQISEYLDRYPQYAAEIRELFPALAMIEDLKPKAGELTDAGAPPSAAVPGRPLERLGDYRILREVGRGGMGIVYEAEQESLGRHVALKVLPPQALLEPRYVARFQREARAAARLHHTNIVPVYGVGHDEGLHYYVMQFIQGQGLDEVLDELRRLRDQRKDRSGSSKASGGQGTSPAAGPEASGNAPAGSKGPAGERAGDSAQTGTYPLAGDAQRAGNASDGPQQRAGNVGHRAAETALAPWSDLRGIEPAPTPEPLAQHSLSTAASLRLPGQHGAEKTHDTGRFYWQSVARIGIQVAEALAYANSQGILHRDIKPSNLLLDNQGTVWVADFGLAKAAAEQSNLSHTGDIVGTLRYMAPERFNGQGDARSDIYSLGLTLYELATLQPAYPEEDRNQLVHQVLHQEPPPPRRLNPEIPRDLETIILKATARDPARRYSTAKELADDLRNFLEDKPIKARRITLRERLVRWCRRNPALASSLAASAAIFLIGFALVAWKWQEERSARAAADLARTDAENKAEEIRRAAERLNRANALVESSRIHAHYQRWADAEKALSQAIELRPDNSLLWTERSQLYLSLGLWDLAQADAAKAWEFGPPRMGVAWHQDALLRLYLGDVEGYRRRLDAMIALMGGGDDPLTALDVARTAALLPNAVDDPQFLVREAQKGLSSPAADGGRLYVLALCHYRAGNLEQAAVRAREALLSPAPHQYGLLLFVQAMTLFRQHKEHEDEARGIYEQGQRHLQQWLETLLTMPVGQFPVPWTEWLELQLLHREATLLFEKSAPELEARLSCARARAFAALQRSDEALAEFHRAVEADPKDRLVRMAFFRFHAEAGEWDKADAHLQKAAELSPEDHNVFMDAFRMLAEKGEWERALAQVGKAVAAAGPVFSPRAISIRQSIRFQAFQLLAQKGQWDLAIAQLDLVPLGVNKENPYALEGVRFLLNRGEFDKAKKEYERVGQRWPNDGRVIEQAAYLFYHAKDYEFAAEQLGVFLKNNPNSSRSGSAWFLKADCHVRLGQWDAAIDAFGEMIKAQPESWNSYTLRGNAYAEKGDWEHALADLEKAVELAKDVVLAREQARVHLALAYLAAGRFSDYERLCVELLKEGGSEVRLDRSTAIAAANACLLSPEFCRAHRRELDAFLSRQFPVRELRQRDNDPFVAAVRGKSAYRAGFSKAAIAFLESAARVQYQPEPVNLFFLAMAYQRDGRKADAERAFDQAVRVVERYGPPGRATPPDRQKRWHERLPYELLRREAEKVVKKPEPAIPPQTRGFEYLPLHSVANASCSYSSYCPW